MTKNKVLVAALVNAHCVDYIEHVMECLVPDRECDCGFINLERELVGIIRGFVGWTAVKRSRFLC